MNASRDSTERSPRAFGYPHPRTDQEPDKWADYERMKAQFVKDAQTVIRPSHTQVGGDHYQKLKIQPWTYIHENGLGYFEGSIVKYVSRWKDKGGVEDLKKARHFLDKLIEVSE